MKALLLGLVLGIVLVFVGAYLYFSRGFAPVATSAPPMPFEERMASMALHARIAKEAPFGVPVPADEPNLTAGARIYREQCAVCHGLAGRAGTETAKGSVAKPPPLSQWHGRTA